MIYGYWNNIIIHLKLSDECKSNKLCFISYILPVMTVHSTASSEDRVGVTKWCANEQDLLACVWWQRSLTWEALSHQHIIVRSNGWHNSCSNMIFCLCVLAVCHLFISWRALYLAWQGKGLGSGSRWKQACVATKDIVITEASEEPLVFNVPVLGRVKQHPLQPSPQQDVRARRLYESSCHSQGNRLSSCRCSHSRMSFSREPTWFVSLQQLSKKREAT